MPFNVGDVVQICTADRIRRGKQARIEKILPKRLSQQDYQEYVVEFLNVSSERFRYLLYREFELRLEGDE